MSSVAQHFEKVDRAKQYVAKCEAELLRAQKEAPAYTINLLLAQQEIYERQAKTLTGHNHEVNQVYLDTLNRAILSLRATFVLG